MAAHELYYFTGHCSVQLDGVHSCRLLHLASQQGVQKCSISCQIKRFDFRRPSTFAFDSIWDTVDFRSCRSRCKIFNGMLLLWRKQSNLHLQRYPLQQKKLSVSPVLCVARLVPSSARQTPVLSPAELPIAVTSGRSLWKHSKYKCKTTQNTKIIFNTYPILFCLKIFCSENPWDFSPARNVEHWSYMWEERGERGRERAPPQLVSRKCAGPNYSFNYVFIYNSKTLYGCPNCSWIMGSGKAQLRENAYIAMFSWRSWISLLFQLLWTIWNFQDENEVQESYCCAFVHYFMQEEAWATHFQWKAAKNDGCDGPYVAHLSQTNQQWHSKEICIYS